jgi:hypothetical protein
LAPDFQIPTDKMPLRQGRVHFMRRVTPDGAVRVLNVDWAVPRFNLLQGVWVTLALSPTAATLTIFDAAPDAAERKQLVVYPFPLKESGLPALVTLEAAAAARQLSLSKQNNRSQWQHRNRRQMNTATPYPSCRHLSLLLNPCLHHDILR